MTSPVIEGDGVAAVPARSARRGTVPSPSDAQRWPAVHRLDAARLYRLAVEAAPAGSRLHAFAEEGIPMREIATAIARQLGVPLLSMSPDEGAAHFGVFGAIVGTDQPAASTRTRERLGWQPTGPALLAHFAASVT